MKRTIITSIFSVIFMTSSCSNQSNETSDLHVHAANLESITTSSGSIYTCIAESLWIKNGLAISGGSTRAEAMKTAIKDCYFYSGDKACVIKECGLTLDTGRSKLDGPTICEWKDVITGLKGFGSAENRLAARKVAMSDCYSGIRSGGGAGTKCQVITCFAQKNPTPL